MAKRNPIEVTFHFNTIEEAIATLGSLIQKAAPVANLDSPAEPVVVAVPVVKQRKPRADAGKPRGPYKGNAADGADKGVTPESVVTDTPAEGAAPSVAPEPAAAVNGDGGGITPSASESLTEQRSGQAASAPTAAAPTPTDTEIQDALTRLFDAKGASVAIDLLGKFGVKRGRDLAPEQRAAFIAKADELAKQPAGVVVKTDELAEQQ